MITALRISEINFRIIHANEVCDEKSFSYYKIIKMTFVETNRALHCVVMENLWNIEVCMGYEMIKFSWINETYSMVTHLKNFRVKD